MSESSIIARSHSLFLAMLCILALSVDSCTPLTSPVANTGPLTTFDVRQGDGLFYHVRTRNGYSYDWDGGGLQVFGVDEVVGKSGAQTLIRVRGEIGSRDYLRMENGCFLGRFGIRGNDTIIRVASFTASKGEVLATWRENYQLEKGTQVLLCTLTCTNPDTMIVVSNKPWIGVPSRMRVSVSTYRKVSNEEGANAIDEDGVMYFSPIYGFVGEEYTTYIGRRRGERGSVYYEYTNTLWEIRKI